MKKMLAVVLVAGFLGGCAYGGVAVNAAGDRAVIARNDSLLFGALRKVIVCKVDAQGLSNCSSSETP